MLPVAPPPPALSATAARTPAAQVLVVANPRGYVHESIPAAQRALGRIGARDGLRVRVLRRASSLTATRLRSARAVVFLDTTGNPPLGRGGRTRLRRFVRGGGGLVLLHASSNAFRNWGAWGPLTGARFVRHPAYRSDRVSTARGDVTTRGVPRSFRVRDEFYVFDRDPRRRGSKVGARLSTHDHRPLAWRRREGHGRVFHDALGHPDAAWRDGDPRLALVRSGLRWASGLRAPRSGAPPG